MPNNSEPPSLDACWAKTSDDLPALSVHTHCLIVGAIAQEILDNLPLALGTTFPPEIATLAALHDVGKLTIGFQTKCPAWKQMHYPLKVPNLGQSEANHAIVSEHFLSGSSDVLSDDLSGWAKAVGAHHGRYQSGRIKPEVDREAFSGLRQELYDKLLSTGFPALPTGTAEDPSKPVSWAIAGLIVACDWLGSNEEFFPLPTSFTEPPPDLVTIRHQARSVLERIGWNRERLSPTEDKAGLFGFSKLNELQTRCLETITEPGLYLVEAPMGGGKTEAALAAAHQLISTEQARGLYFALPTQLTSNLIHKRIASFLSNAGVEGSQALAHSSSWILNPVELQIPCGGQDLDRTSPDFDEAVARPWFTSRKALLANFGTGTIDQALMGAIPVKFFFLRLFGLAGKVVVFDEVHSYDSYTGTLLNDLIKYLLELHCTVLVLSATLTKRHRKELLGLAENRYPSARIYEATGRSRPITLHHEYITDAELTPDLLERIAEEAGAGKCVVVIRNTVQLAQETYSRLTNQVSQGIEVGLLHSRFPHYQRYGHPDLGSAGREDFWVERLGKDPTHRPCGCILVSTQVIEQSVDVSADLLVTDLCPADQLLQRLGRLHRHQFGTGKAHPCRPEAWILHPTQPESANPTGKEIRDAFRPHGYIYSPFVLARTSALVSARETLQFPADISELLEATYQYSASDQKLVQDDLGEGMAELFSELQRTTQDLKDRASKLSRDTESGTHSDDELLAITRHITQQTVDLVLLDSAPVCQDSVHTISPLDGTIPLKWHELEPWSANMAKAVFRNTCRIPRYFLAQDLPVEPSPWLAKHAAGTSIAVAAIRHPNGLLEFLAAEAAGDFELYHSNGAGVFRKEVLDETEEEDSSTADDSSYLNPSYGLDGCMD